MISNKEIALLSSYCIDLQSFLLLKAGEKPVIRICADEQSMDKNRLNDLKIFSSRSGIKLHLVRMTEMFGAPLERPLMVYYLSLLEDLSQKAYAADLIGDRKALGKLLGYPECCINAFLDNLQNDFKTDHVISALKKTSIMPSFYCNNIYNFDSKLSAGLSFQTFALNYQIFSRLEPLFLIRHVPCSYDCQKSIEIGQKTLMLLNRENKLFAKKVVASLKVVVLYFDYFNWLIFDGKISDDTLIYNRILPYDSIVSKNVINDISHGNRLELTDSNIRVFKNKKMIHKIPKQNFGQGVLISFV